MRVLGIESSCDETAVAIYDNNLGLLAHTIHSQIDLHAEYGGVVPELAARDHLSRLIPLVTTCLQQARLNLTDLDYFAYTAGPGLAGALLTGATFASSLAFATNKPTCPVHHLEAHLLSPFLSTPAPQWPFLALLISGGHTQMIVAHALGQYELIGETIDDAIGEAFDKTAKMLGLSYPGGPKLSLLSENGTKGRFHFPRPLLTRMTSNFSFAGLKTAVLTQIKNLEKSGETMSDQTRADIALAFIDSVVDIIIFKIKVALEQTGLKQLVIAGGVSANQQLRSALQQLAEQHDLAIFFPPPAFCTDNAAMIALTATLRLEGGLEPPPHVSPNFYPLSIYPRWSMYQ